MQAPKQYGHVASTFLLTWTVAKTLGRATRGVSEFSRARGILRGQNPEGSQARRPAGGTAMKFELVINLKMAKQIPLTIPPNLLSRAVIL